MKYFFRISYNGTRYCGWQNQPNGISIQHLIEEALTVVLRTPCAIVGAGRTDAGVHARAQGAHFEIEGENINTDKLTNAINSILPYDIAVYNMISVSPNFHARFSATARQYKYYISTRKNPLCHNTSWAMYYKTDWERVIKEIETLRGEHDFTAFCSAGADTKSKVCNIENANLSFENDNIIVFTIRANRFIYKMVRSLVGTLVDIGQYKFDKTLNEILISKDRELAGRTAPACGLVLDDVIYGGHFD